MDETLDVLTAEQMKHCYGRFYEQSPKLHLVAADFI